MAVTARRTTTPMASVMTRMTALALSTLVASATVLVPFTSVDALTSPKAIATAMATNSML